MINTQGYFETSDFPLAISTLCLGFQMIDLDKKNPKRVIFKFQKTEKLEKVINDFYNDKLLVNPQDFFNKQKLLKSRIYE